MDFDEKSSNYFFARTFDTWLHRRASRSRKMVNSPATEPPALISRFVDNAPVEDEVDSWTRPIYCIIGSGWFRRRSDGLLGCEIARAGVPASKTVVTWVRNACFRII